MVDLRFEAKNNQKKEVSAFATIDTIDTSATMADLLFTLPEASLVTRAYAIVLVPSGVSGATIKINVGTVSVGSAIKVDAAGVSTGTQAMTYFPTGGSVTVIAGATAPDNAGVLKIVVEYIETSRSEGTYTD